MQLERRAHARSGVEMELAPSALTEIRAVAGEENTFEAYAQLYGQANDYGEIFLPGCFSKSIQERVKGPRGSRVRINGSHSWEARDICGTVIDAREEVRGLWVKGKMASTSDAQDLRAKMLEGHLDEFSIEFRCIRETFERVEDETYRHVHEAVFWGLAILPYSSQGEPALIEVRGAVPYQDLPIAPDDTVWDPAAAAERVAQWSKGQLAGGVPNLAQLRRAYAFEDVRHRGAADAFRLQIADVIGGRLMVVPKALMRAAAAATVERIDEAARRRVQDNLTRYIDRLEAEGRSSRFRAPWDGALDRILVELRSGAELTEVDQALLAEALPVLSAAVGGAPNQETTDAGPAATEATPPTEKDSEKRQAKPANADRLAQLREAELRLANLSMEAVRGQSTHQHRFA